MTGIRTLRIATDFSSFAESAIQRGLQVARQAGVTEVEICHVLERHRVRALRALLPAIAELQEHQQARLEAALADRAAALSADAGMDVLGCALEGEVSAALVKNSDAHTLLVVGHRGTDSVRKIALGSVAEAVVRTSEAPVLVVKKPPAEAYQHVLVAVDFSADSVTALHWVRHIAPQARLTVLHAYPPLPEESVHALLVSKEDFEAYQARIRREASVQMDKLLADAGLRPEQVDVVTDHGYPPELVEQEVLARKVDLVIAGKHGHSRFADWLLGSVTSRILLEVAADVLVVSTPA